MIGFDPMEIETRRYRWQHFAVLLRVSYRRQVARERLYGQYGAATRAAESIAKYAHRAAKPTDVLASTCSISEVPTEQGNSTIRCVVRGFRDVHPDDRETLAKMVDTERMIFSGDCVVVPVRQPMLLARSR